MPRYSTRQELESAGEWHTVTGFDEFMAKITASISDNVAQALQLLEGEAKGDDYAKSLMQLVMATLDGSQEAFRDYIKAMKSLTPKTPNGRAMHLANEMAVNASLMANCAVLLMALTSRIATAAEKAAKRDLGIEEDDDDA